MGKTVESYRIAIEDEIQRWKGFANALRSSDREAFERLMDACRGYASAGGNSTQPILFEPMTMSMLLSLQTQVQKIQKELDAYKQSST
ncbi:MAG: hypothetical protein ACM3WQ_02625 [Chloroflexota bacterium]|nr:hypothetical protein [Candidatus Sulfotelmatobacter sp.]